MRMPEAFDQRAARWLPALYAAPVLIYLALAFFVRFLADDYCLGVKSGQFGGLINVVLSDYQNWFGRYSASLLTNAMVYPGLPWIQINVVLTLLVWLAGLAWLCAEISALLGMKRRWQIGIALGLVWLAATLSGAPLLMQSVYWPNSLNAYPASALTLPFLAALLLRGARLRWQGARLVAGALAAMLLSAYAAGFTEPHTAVQLGGLALALLALRALHVRSRAASVLLAASLLATIAATIVLVAAPGNAVRASLFEPQPLATAAVNSVIHSAAFIAASMLNFSPMGALAAVIVPALLLSVAGGQAPALSQRAALLGITACLLTGLVLISGYMLPGFYATSQPPPARSYIIPQFIWMGALVGAGMLAGLRLRRSRRHQPVLRRAGVLVGAIAAIALSMHAIRFIGPLSQHAAAWDGRDASIRAAVASGATDMVVPPLVPDLAASIGLETIGPDAEGWINQCAAAWYGLRTLRTATADEPTAPAQLP